MPRSQGPASLPASGDLPLQLLDTFLPSLLASIQQGMRDFASYVAEFHRYAAEVEWGEVAKLAALQRGLSYRLKNDLVTTPEEPTTISEFTTLCNKLDLRRRALQSEQHSHTPRPSPSTSRPAPRPHVPVAPAIAPAPTTTATGTAPGPMDLSAYRGPVS